MRGAEALARLHSAARLFVNVFQPSFKLAEKTRVGAGVHKRYHAPATPCARLLASDTVPAAMKGRLRALAGTLDPLGLLDEVRAIQHHLAGLPAGSTVHPMPQRDADLDGFCGAWRWLGALARCDRRTGLARDRRDIGALGRTCSRRRGLVSSSGGRVSRARENSGRRLPPTKGRGAVVQLDPDQANADPAPEHAACSAPEEPPDGLVPPRNT